MNQWQQLSEKYIALTQREKIIIAFTVIFLLTYGVFFVAIKPAIKNLQDANKINTSVTKQLAGVRTQIDEIRTALQKDPNEPIKIEIAALKTQLSEIESRLSIVMTEYVAPEHMATELTSLLKTERQLRVTGLAIKPPTLVKATGISADKGIELPKLFSHEFELTVDGEYFPLMNFVKTIIAKNKHFAVIDLKYVVKKHPKAQLTLSLVTISDSENVIRL